MVTGGGPRQFGKTTVVYLDQATVPAQMGRLNDKLPITIGCYRPAAAVNDRLLSNIWTSPRRGPGSGSVAPRAD
jgi:hypothetical protein